MTKDTDVEKLVFGKKLRFFALGIRCNNIKKNARSRTSRHFLLSSVVRQGITYCFQIHSSILPTDNFKTLKEYYFYFSTVCRGKYQIISSSSYSVSVREILSSSSFSTISLSVCLISLMIVDRGFQPATLAFDYSSTEKSSECAQKYLTTFYLSLVSFKHLQGILSFCIFSLSVETDVPGDFDC